VKERIGCGGLVRHGCKCPEFMIKGKGRRLIARGPVAII
jgi:hypothetical protein